MKNFCPECGKKIVNNPNFCPKCAHKLVDGSFESKTITFDDINFKDLVVEHYKTKSNMIVFHVIDLLENSTIDYDMLMHSAKTGIEPVRSHIKEIDKITNLSPRWEEAKNSYKNAMLDTLKMLNCVIESAITSDIKSERHRDEIQSKIDEATEYMDKSIEHFNRFQEIFKSLF